MVVLSVFAVLTSHRCISSGPRCCNAFRQDPYPIQLTSAPTELHSYTCKYLYITYTLSPGWRISWICNRNEHPRFEAWYMERSCSQIWIIHEHALRAARREAFFFSSETSNIKTLKPSMGYMCDTEIKRISEINWLEKSLRLQKFGEKKQSKQCSKCFEKH